VVFLDADAFVQHVRLLKPYFKHINIFFMAKVSNDLTLGYYAKTRQ